MSPARRWLGSGLSVLVLALAGWLLWRQLQALSLAQLQAAWLSTRAGDVALSLGATGLSFACLAAYEALATNWIAPGRIPRATAWRVGLEAHALANTFGFHAVIAVALRLRAYRPLGIDAATVAKIVATVGGCVAGGVIAIVVVALGWSQLQAGHAGLVGAVVACLLAAIALLRVRAARSAPSPVLAHAGSLALIGLLEMASAVAALAVLLPAGALPEGPQLLLLFVTAMVLGIISHSPGGLGVFEASILAAAVPARRAEVVVALIAWRAIYNLLPCLLALLAMGGARLRPRRPATAAQFDAG